MPFEQLFLDDPIFLPNVRRNRLDICRRRKSETSGFNQLQVARAQNREKQTISAMRHVKLVPGSRDLHSDTELFEIATLK